MLKPEQISNITKQTLNSMGFYEPSLERLVKGTFLAQSNLESLYDDVDKYKKRRGLMLMSDSDAREIIGEYIRYRPDDRKTITKATGVDLFNLSLEDTLMLLETNISFMVAVTAMFYSSHYIVVPDNNINSIAITYKEYFNEDADVNDFVVKYTKTFIT